jgi:hypothetical protein
MVYSIYVESIYIFVKKSRRVSKKMMTNIVSIVSRDSATDEIDEMMCGA